MARSGSRGGGRRNARAAKPKAEKAAKAAVVRENGIAPVFALHKIDGKPSKRVFVPATAALRAELFALGAVRECTPAELNLMNLDRDNSGEPGGSLSAEAAAAAAGEAGDGEAGDGEAGDGEAGDGEAGDGEAGEAGEAGDGEAGDSDEIS